MSFSFAVLLAAMFHAGIGVAAGSRAATLGSAVLRSLLASAASTTALTALWIFAADWFRAFALAHVAYLALVVTVPMMAATALAIRAIAPNAWLSPQRSATVLAIGLLPAIVGFYATHIEPGRLRVDHQQLLLDYTLSTTTPGDLRIGVIGDVQTDHIGDYENDALDRLLAEDLDLLLVTGDLWQMTQDEIAQRWPQFRAYVERMVAGVPHVVIVEGDTDTIGWLRTVTDGTGGHLLADEIIELDVDGRSVHIAGLVVRDEFGPNSPSRVAAESLGDAGDDTLTILLAHRPDAIANLQGPIDLVVAGHTHGGQVAVPLIGPLVTFSDVPRHVAAGGLHEIDGQGIYVTTGVGVERGHAPQVRFFSRPSVGVINIRQPAG